jgi:hypothetical protein
MENTILKELFDGILNTDVIIKDELGDSVKGEFTKIILDIAELYPKLGKDKLKIKPLIDDIMVFIYGEGIADAIFYYINNCHNKKNPPHYSDMEGETVKLDTVEDLFMYIMSKTPLYGPEI